MRVTDKHTALVWALSLLARQATATYWINQLDNYSSLPVCAEGPISTIVRGMVKGCGDGGRATSYSCFCTQSSSAFKDMIASSVEKECSGTGSEVVSATALFEEYCSLGIKQTSATTTGSGATTSTSDSNSSKTNTVATSTSASQTESNSSASTTASASVTTNTSTINSVPSTTASSITESTSSTAETSDAGASSSSSASLATGAKVAIGICIPLAVIAIAAAIFIFFRRRRETKRMTHTEELDWKAERRFKCTPNQLRSLMAPPTRLMSPLSVQSQPLDFLHRRSLEQSTRRPS